METRVVPARPARLVLLAFVAAFAFAAVGPLANPAPVQAGTAANMEAKILSWINAERGKRGVAPLRLRASLVDLAGDRAAKMASTNELKHPKCLSCKLNRRNIPWHVCGETIAFTTWPWGTQAATSIYNGWKGSPGHWNILMSRDFNRIGIGVAYRSSNRSTWAAAVLTG